MGIEGNGMKRVAGWDVCVSRAGAMRWLEGRERPERPERYARPERPERYARPERPERYARPERPERYARP